MYNGRFRKPGDHLITKKQTNSKSSRPLIFVLFLKLTLPPPRKLSRSDCSLTSMMDPIAVSRSCDVTPQYSVLDLYLHSTKSFFPWTSLWISSPGASSIRRTFRLYLHWLECDVWVRISPDRTSISHSSQNHFRTIKKAPFLLLFHFLYLETLFYLTPTSAFSFSTSAVGFPPGEDLLDKRHLNLHIIWKKWY